jgi:hypothetical protein
MAREDYVEVSERIRQFIEAYPAGSLQTEWEYVQRDGEQWLVVKAWAYRSAEDVRPGIGHAWEPIPGRTPYTKGSELMNGETSAWGRALAAIGIAVHKGIASANEVRSAQGRSDDPVATKSAEMGSYRTPSGGHRQEGAAPATAKQLGMLRATMSKQHVSEALLADYTAQQLGFELPVDGLTALTKAQCSVIIDAMLKATPSAPVTRSSGPVEDDPWVTS